MSDTFNINDLNINMKTPQIKNLRSIISVFVLGFLIMSSVYTVDANENAVILRFGAYADTKGPGLHFKIPFIETSILPGGYQGDPNVFTAILFMLAGFMIIFLLEFIANKKKPN